MDNILIAMSNTEDSLDLVRSVANTLDDASHTRVTLMHYLVPIYWEHGGDPSNNQELQEILHEEEQVSRIEEMQMRRSRDYFAEAHRILTEAGVSSDHVLTRLTSDGADLAHAVLREIDDGNYTAVAVGDRERSLLERLFNRSLASFLRSHTDSIRIMDIPLH